MKNSSAERSSFKTICNSLPLVSKRANNKQRFWKVKVSDSSNNYDSSSKPHAYDFLSKILLNADGEYNIINANGEYKQHLVSRLLSGNRIKHSTLLINDIVPFICNHSKFTVSEAAKRVQEYLTRQGISPITKDSEIFNAFLQHEELNFDRELNKDIIALVRNIAKSEPDRAYKALVVMMIVYLFPCDYGNHEISDRDKLQISDNLRTVINLFYNEFNFLLSSAETAKEADDILTITLQLKATAQKQLEAMRERAGRFISRALWDKYPVIELPTLRCTVGGKDDENAQLSELVKKYEENLLVTGGGGCGKTYTLINLCESLLEENGTIPFYIPLNSITVSIKEYIYERMTEYSGFTKAECEQRFNIWRREANGVQLLLLLDGFNEISSADLQSSFAAQIIDLISEKIRVVVTSRYDMSPSFVRGSGSAVVKGFKSFRVNSLQQTVVENYIREFFANDDIAEKAICDAYLPNGRLNELFQSPMGLIMYCYMKAALNVEEAFASDSIVKLPHRECVKTGELIDNFLHCIMGCYNKDKYISRYSGFLAFLGYRMNCDGVFQFEHTPIIKYAESYFKSSDEITEFMRNPFVNDVLRINKQELAFEVVEYSVEFVHQNYRDFFAASHLYGRLINNKIGEINECFGEFIPAEALTLLGDISGEYKCADGGASRIQNTLSNKDLKLTPAVVAQLIRTAAIARSNDLSAMDFSGVDLTATRLNKIKLYKNVDHKAKFDRNTKVSKTTFAPLGHEGAVNCMLYIKERYILSFSKNGIFCFDMKQHRHYKVAPYPSHAIRAAYHDEKTSSIITGDEKSDYIMWRYDIRWDDERFALQQLENREFSYNAAAEDVDGTAFGEPLGEEYFFALHSEINDIVSLNGNHIIIGFNNGYFFFDHLYDWQSENSGMRIYHARKLFNELGICRLSVGNNEVYASCGKTIGRFKLDDNSKLTAKGTETIADDIFQFTDKEILDIAVFNEYLLINTAFESKANKKSSVYAVPISAFDDINSFAEKMQIVYQREYSTSSKGFKGWVNFSEQFENVIYLTANIEDAPEDAGLLRISAQNNEGEIKFIASECYATRHTMKVNCALPFTYSNKHYIATGSNDRSIQILQADGGEITMLYHLLGHDNGVHTLDIVNDNKIITADYSGEVCAWEKRNSLWKCTHCLSLHSGWVWQTKHISYKDSGYIISCSYDNTITVVNDTTEELICRITEPTGRVLTFGMLNDTLLLIGYLNGTENVLQKIQIDYENKTYQAGKINLAYKGDNLRYIAPSKEGLLLCFNNGNSGIVREVKRSGNKNLNIIKIINGPEYSDKEGNINLRCADEIIHKDYTIIAVGGDKHNAYKMSRAYINITVIDKYHQKRQLELTEVYFGENCSALKLISFDDELYLCIGNYNEKVYIFRLDICDGDISCKPIAERRIFSKVLDIKYLNKVIYASALNGKVLAISLDKVLADKDAMKEYSTVRYGYSHYYDQSSVNISNMIAYFTAFQAIPTAILIYLRCRMIGAMTRILWKN